jgi:hypothetical protein
MSFKDQLTQKMMIARKLIYTIGLLIMVPAILFGQSSNSEMRREVKLYNPFKPTLSKETKIGFQPNMSDTSSASPLFEYTISPNPFMPKYEVREIAAARLEPDPLPKLYKSYLNIGFGNYFSPIAELSISSERSRNRILGFYANHTSSFGKVTLDNDESVNAGYMDNIAKMYGTKFFRRSALSADIDFSHMQRYAYGYDPGIGVLPEPGKDSLRLNYFNPGADISFYSTRLDSNHFDYDIKLFYDLFYQNSDLFRHRAGTRINAGYNLKVFYAKAKVEYEYYNYGEEIDFRPRHVVTLDPSISKKTAVWSFKVGFKSLTDSRNEFDPADILPPEYKTKLYFYPDVRFQFSVIPSFMSIYVSLDGEHQSNNAPEIASLNQFIVTENVDGSVMPVSDLYTMKPTDHKLRVGGGVLGSMGENSSYRLTASYSLFEDLLLFSNDLNTGRGFTPLYDNGELLLIHGEIATPLNDHMRIGATANFYNYKLESEEHPWHKPSWDGLLRYEYNLRNKIIASAELYGISNRYVEYGPMSYSALTDPTIEEMPVHFSLNMGVEYRYTKILSFWTKLNNISNNRYFEWNFYPSQRFIFMAGFTYSL